MPALRPVLLALLLLASGAMRAEGPAAARQVGSEGSLQAELDRLYALRTIDTPAFVAQVKSLEALPAPTQRAQREFLAFLSANRDAFEGRFDAAIARAEPLAEGAESEALRLRAASFIINMQAGTREFEPALRRLETLLRAHAELTPGLEAEITSLWNVASIFYNQLGQHALAVEYANALAAASSTPRHACLHGVQLAIAGSEGRAFPLDDAQFATWRTACEAEGETTMVLGFLSIAEARFLRDADRLDEALARLGAELGAIDSTRYPRLTSEAYALDAELLLAAGRPREAERQARQALVLAKDMPTSLPAAMAQRVLYDIAQQRGDTGAALRYLQGLVAANRALAEETRMKEHAFRTVQAEQQQREHAAVLKAERERVLALEDAVARGESQQAKVLAGVAVFTVVLCALGFWHSRRQSNELKRQAETDALTGLANRQHFTRVAEAALRRRRQRRDRAGLMLVSFDLDHFKQVNDCHGHLAGDAVLRAVGGAVRSVPAPNGIARHAGRLGGEEFALLLDGATPEQAEAHAEACRIAISALRIPLDDGGFVSVTASFGITGTHEAGDALDALLAESDRLLYGAKSSGRNRIVRSAAARDRVAA